MRKHYSPEVEAMRKIMRALEPLGPAQRARVLASVTLMYAPNALDERGWLRLIRAAQQEDVRQ